MNPRQAPQVSVKEIDGQFLVLDRARGQLHELNVTASFIWQRCDGQTPVTDIAAAVAEVFETDPGTAERDVAATLQQFEACQLIEYESPPFPPEKP